MRLLDFPDPHRRATTSGLIGEASVDGAFGPAALEGHGFMTTHFSAGAHTEWHRHPLDQVLIVASGSGLLQIDGLPAQRLQQGDVIHIPAETLHWHGADSDSPLVQITITDALAGVAVEWGDSRRACGPDTLTDQHVQRAA